MLIVATIGLQGPLEGYRGLWASASSARGNLEGEGEGKKKREDKAIGGCWRASSWPPDGANAIYGAAGLKQGRPYLCWFFLKGPMHIEAMGYVSIVTATL